MTDQTADYKDQSKAAAAAIAPSSSVLPSKAAAPPPRPKGGRGLAGLALLLALGAGGASGYLWYLWQQDQAQRASRLAQAIQQVVEPRVAALNAEIQKLQGLEGEFSQARTANQNVREQLLGLTGDLQPLKNAMELQKGASEVLKGELKLLRESQETAKTGIQQQNQDLEAKLQAQLQRLEQLGEQLKNLQLAHNALATNFDTLTQVTAKGGDMNAFTLAEVGYLLRLADSQLKLERNLPSARLALETAQQRLKTVTENILAPVQTQLGEVLVSLRGVQLPDLSALAHKVMEMRSQVALLPVKINTATPDPKTRFKPNDNVTLSSDAERHWWDRTTEAVWNQFKGIVVIRRTRSDGPPLIALEDEFFLRQNLLLELESLRMALLGEDAQAYQDTYALIDSWLQQYFDTTDARVEAFANELKALRAVQFKPYVPDVTGLVQAFQEAMARRQPVRAAQPAPVITVEPATTKEAR